MYLSNAKIINLSLFSYLHKKHSLTDYTIELHRPGWSLFPFSLQSLHRTKTSVDRVCVCVTAQDAIIVVDQMIVFFMGGCTIQSLDVAVFRRNVLPPSQEWQLVQEDVIGKKNMCSLCSTVWGSLARGSGRQNACLMFLTFLVRDVNINWAVTVV